MFTFSGGPREVYPFNVLLKRGPNLPFFQQRSFGALHWGPNILPGDHPWGLGGFPTFYNQRGRSHQANSVRQGGQPSLAAPSLRRRSLKVSHRSRRASFRIRHRSTLGPAHVSPTRGRTYIPPARADLRRARACFPTQTDVF